MAKNQKKVGTAKSEIVSDIPLACADEKAAVEFLEKHRWKDAPCCPECGDTDVYTITMRCSDEREKNGRWRCRGCGKLYSVRTGTVMEESRIPLRHWVYAFWRATTSKKGVSAKEIQRHTGVSYKSALFLMHRIRFAMADGLVGKKLSGVVECDEAFIGGKPRHKATENRGLKTKQPIMAMVERNGRVHTRVIANVTGKILKGAIREVVDKASTIMTDENWCYKAIGKEYDGGHKTVNHKKHQYVNGDIYTNTVEGYFSLVKRGVYGIWHNVSRKHLHRYLAATEFRYNHRHLEDGERVVAAIKAGEGKRLVYRKSANMEDAA